MPLFRALIFIAHIVLAILAIIDIAKSKQKSGGTKALWIIIAIIVPIIGPILYYLLGRDK